MSEDIIICKKCQALMEFYKSYDMTLSDGLVHVVEEYSCRACKITVKRDLGAPIPDSQSYTQSVNSMRA